MTDQARELYQKGRQFYLQGEYAHAYGSLLAAWKLNPVWAIAGMLGATELKLGRYAQAAEHLTIAIRTWAPTGTHDTRPELENLRPLREQALAHVAKVNVTAAPGAEIFVDGQTAGPTPLPDPVFIDPGHHTIEARRGSQNASAAIDATAGASYESRLSFRDEPVSKAGTSAPSAAPEPPRLNAKADARPPAPDETRTAVLVSGTALAAVGLAVGIGFRIKAANDEDRASALSGESKMSIGAGWCAQPTANCEDLRDAYSRWSTSRDLSIAGFVGFAVFGAGTLATLLFWPSHGPPSSAIAVVPPVHGGASQIVWKGQF